MRLEDKISEIDLEMIEIYIMFEEICEKEEVEEEEDEIKKKKVKVEKKCRENEVKSYGEIEWELEKRIVIRKIGLKRVERVLVMLWVIYKKS